MSPIFTPDFATVDANIPIYEGRARVQLTKRTPFAKESKPDDDGNVHTTSGVRFGLEMVGMFDDEGELQTDNLKGKVVTPVVVWCHSTGGWQFAKPFVMAACGFARKDEQRANEELFQDEDTSWDFAGEIDAAPDTFELGNGWDLLVGNLVDVTLSKSITKSKDGETNFENQEYAGWAPVS